MTALAFDHPAFDMGRVIKRTFTLIGRHSVLFGMLTLILVVIPQYAIFQLETLLIRRGVSLLSYSSAVSILTTYLFHCWMQGAVAVAVAADVNGRRPELGTCLLAVLRSLLPITAMAIMTLAAVTVGLVMLVIPGLFLMTTWAVIFPALAVDRTGVLGAFHRSAELTRFHRASILGLMVTVWVLNLGLHQGHLALDRLLPAWTQSLPGNWPEILIGYLFQSVESIIAAAGTACIYFELRSIKDGAGSESLAVVFD
jgi:hypothetical protein